MVDSLSCTGKDAPADIQPGYDQPSILYLSSQIKELLRCARMEIEPSWGDFDPRETRAGRPIKNVTRFLGLGFLPPHSPRNEDDGSQRPSHHISAQSFSSVLHAICAIPHRGSRSTVSGER